MPKKTAKEKEIIRIITPPIASTGRDLDLVKLTKHFVKTKKCERVGGLLGGEFGYGCDFKNNVFEMRPFCYDDCECLETGHKKHLPNCSVGLPNFKHYKSGLQIRWYKWIGRDMEFNKKITDKQWKEIFHECVESIKKK